MMYMYSNCNYVSMVDLPQNYRKMNIKVNMAPFTTAD